VCAALEGIGLAYTFEALALPYISRQAAQAGAGSVLAHVPDFYLDYPSRHNQSTKLKALIEYVTRHTSSRGR
jgi:hypothetical protein